MGYQKVHIKDSLWLMTNVTSYKWRVIRVLIDIGVKDGDAGETWLYEAFNVDSDIHLSNYFEEIFVKTFRTLVIS